LTSWGVKSHYGITKEEFTYIIKAGVASKLLQPLFTGDDGTKDVRITSTDLFALVYGVYKLLDQVSSGRTVH
jgi:hypothetical protein